MSEEKKLTFPKISMYCPNCFEDGQVDDEIEVGSIDIFVHPPGRSPEKWGWYFSVQGVCKCGCDWSFFLYPDGSIQLIRSDEGDPDDVCEKHRGETHHDSFDRIY